MSRVAGIIRFDEVHLEPQSVAVVTGFLSGQGTVVASHWSGEAGVVGHRVLPTTPQSLAETQPLLNDDGTLVLVMDGRIDNREELDEVLRGTGIALRSHSDAELVLRAYETWGSSCLDHIDGDFAFVVWDIAKRHAFCARDRFGIKPFYYHFDGKVLSFASEMRPLLDLSWVPNVFNEGMAVEFLGADWRSTDETFWQDVMRLPPNSSMTVTAGGKAINSYWHPDCTIHDPPWSDDEYVEQYRMLLMDAVRQQSRSQVPLACEVSGGLDSSALYALADALHRDGRLGAPDLKGYTLYFDPQTGANDLPYARDVADHLGRVISEVEPVHESLEWSARQVAVEAEFPSYPNGTMGLGIRRSTVSDGCRALLVGIGGDEILSSGRNYYADTLRSRSFNDFIRYFRADAEEAGLARAIYWSIRHGFYRLIPDKIREFLSNRIFHRWAGRGYRPKKWLSAEALAILERRKRRNIPDNDILASLLHPYSVWAREREGLDAERLGVELRYPFLSRRLVEFAMRLPSRTRVRGIHYKWLHRKALQGYLPQSVLERQGKASFMNTFHRHLAGLDVWLKGETWRTDLGHLINSASLEEVRKDATAQGFGGWPEFMLWTAYGCAVLSQRKPQRKG